MFQSAYTRLRGGKRVKHAVSSNNAKDLTDLADLLQREALKPIVDHIYPMAEIAQAHRHVESRHRRGSVIVAMNNESPSA